MSFSESDAKLIEQYSDTTSTELEMFNNYIRKLGLEDQLQAIRHQLVEHDPKLNDFKASYKNRFPASSVYKSIINNYLNKTRQRADFESEDMIQKFSHLPIEKLMDKCTEIRNKEKIESVHIDFLTAWEILCSENYQAEQHGLSGHELIKYMDYVKICAIKKIVPDRPYTNEKDLEEFKRSSKVQKFSDIKGRF